MVGSLGWDDRTDCKSSCSFWKTIIQNVHYWNVFFVVVCLFLSRFFSFCLFLSVCVRVDTYGLSKPKE